MLIRYPGKQNMGRKLQTTQAQQELIHQLFVDTSMTLEQIASAVGVSYRVVWRYTAEMFSKEQRRARKVVNYRASKTGDKNPMTGKTRENHPNWKGGVYCGGKYLRIYRPAWYDKDTSTQSVHLHDVVYCLHNGMTHIPAGYNVHHCDGNKYNNAPDNLVLLTIAEHTALHAVLKGATTISKESTLKWVEARRNGKTLAIDDIV